jgi:pyrimidine operon attenuation protein/uracil phosphoribosyltransferase
MGGDSERGVRLASEQKRRLRCDIKTMQDCAVIDETVYRGDHKQISLCETLDRVLNKGVVVAGEVVISVADVDLIYLNLQVLLTSLETAIALQETSRPNHRPSHWEDQ